MSYHLTISNKPTFLLRIQELAEFITPCSILSKYSRCSGDFVAWAEIKEGLLRIARAATVVQMSKNHIKRSRRDLRDDCRLLI